MNPEHWLHPGLGLGSLSGVGTGKRCSLELRLGESEAHEGRVRCAPRSDAHAGTTYMFLACAKRPARASHICMVASCLSPGWQPVSTDFHLRHWGNIFKISRSLFKPGRWAPWYQPDARIPSTPGAGDGFPPLVLSSTRSRCRTAP